VGGLALRAQRPAVVGGQRRDVDRRLGVRREHDQRHGRREAGERAAGAQRGDRAVQPADVEDALHTIGDMIAAILESGELERLTTGLSLLVSAAADGRTVRALAMHGALGPLLDPALLERAMDPAAAPHVADAGREAFARTLVELRAAARELDGLRIWACAGALEATGIDRGLAEARLDGVLSMPRFLREVEGAELVVV
jgi:peroxiredoxin family protein